MATVKQVEAQIQLLETFSVTIRYPVSRRDVRSDRENLPTYKTKYERASREAFTVSDWKTKRFAKHYPGFEVDVLRPDGRIANGHTRLANLREEYRRP